MLLRQGNLGGVWRFLQNAPMCKFPKNKKSKNSEFEEKLTGYFLEFPKISPGLSSRNFRYRLLGQTGAWSRKPRTKILRIAFLAQLQVVKPESRSIGLRFGVEKLTSPRQNADYFTSTALAINHTYP
jgi:hypothetical protein